MTEILYWYEDFTPGREFTFPSRTITAEEIVEFASEFDPQPFHIDEDAGRNSILGGLAASGWHTCSINMRQFYDAFLAQSSSQGAPGIDLCEWRRPVIAGDTLTGKAIVLESRLLRSRPGIGMVRLRHELKNQNGDLVMVIEHPAMIKLREAS